jgi:hypothetical protein
VTRPWVDILARAVRVVAEYPYLITLRQLHYRLVMTAGLGYANTLGDYKQLSSRTAQKRRAGTFPALLDQTRQIHQTPHWTSPRSALQALAGQYRLDRSEGQEHLIVIAGEKATLLAQLHNWFSDLGLPIVLTRGYGSQTYLDDVAAMAWRDGRPAVLIYAGDLDPSGEDILRDFTERCDVFDKVERIAVLPSQIADLGLAVNAGKASDSRAGRFVADHPELGLVQVEVEAIPPDTLRDLYQTALDDWFDVAIYDEVIEREEAQRARIAEIADNFT